MAVLTVQGYSSKTLLYYKRYLDHFLAHLDTESKDIFCLDRKAADFVDYSCLLRWMQGLRLTKVKEGTIQQHKSALNTWYKWLIRIGKVERNPIETLPAIKVPEVDPSPLAINDTEKVLQGLDAMTWRHGERNRAILELFYASGLRLNELRHLDMIDLMIDDPRPHVKVRQGKGKKDGIGMLTPPAVEAIKAWLPKRAKILRKFEKGKDWAPLFVSRTGDRLCEWRIWDLVVEVGKKILGKRIHPHQFRHSFCTDLLNRGADLESIRKLARHAKLTTTQKYLSVSTEHLMEAYSRHPGMKPRKKPPEEAKE